MGLYSGGLIIGRIFASEILGRRLIFGRAYLGVGGGGRAYYSKVTVFHLPRLALCYM